MKPYGPVDRRSCFAGPSAASGAGRGSTSRSMRNPASAIAAQTASSGSIQNRTRMLSSPPHHSSTIRVSK